MSLGSESKQVQISHSLFADIVGALLSNRDGRHWWGYFLGCAMRHISSLL